MKTKEHRECEIKTTLITIENKNDYKELRNYITNISGTTLQNKEG